MLQGGHVGGQYNRIFSRRIYTKIEFSSQRREMHLFLTINMAAVTSRANQQFGEEKKTACNDIYAFPRSELKKKPSRNNSLSSFLMLRACAITK